MAQLEVRDLTFSYGEFRQKALCSVELSVEAGSFVVICGPSGCGKSTLLRHCKPMLAPYGRKAGDLFWEGTPLSQLGQREQSSRIGYVGQHPDGQIVTDKVWHELAFGMESLGYDTPTIRRRVAEMASFFGIQTWFYREIATLSGGQKQLLNLASVMTLGPDLLLLDEPTSQLDPIAAAEFLQMLGKINRELGVTVLLSEHRLEEALPMADHVVVMEKGRVFCQGTPAEVGAQLRACRHPMARAMPAPMQIWGAVSQGEGSCPVTVREGRTWFSQYVVSHPLKELSPEPVHSHGEVILRGRDLWFRYERELPDVIKGLSLSVREGEIFALLGGNGTGKSTALGLLAGLYRPVRGKVQRWGKTALLPQDPQTVFVRNSLREDLLDQIRLEGLSPEDGEKRLDWVVSLCRLGPLLSRHPYDLSGGEQQRGALARVLLTKPEILLLDEPTKGLDPGFQGVLASILEDLTKEGTAVVMVSHDTEFCARYAHRCALFFDGSIVTEDSPRQFFSGNAFYTTAANRMVRAILPQAVTVREVVEACGAELPEQLLPPSPPLEEEEGSVQEPSAAQGEKRKKKGHSFRMVLSIAILLLLIPVTLWFGITVLEGRKYYFISLLILLEVSLPFFLAFEGRKPKARELVLLASLCALGVAGRGVFFMLPQCKPVTTLTIITGASLGPSSGFLVGALTMLVSNLFFGQGPWTPFQMFAMGLIGFLAGVLFYGRGLPKKGKMALCGFGFGAVLLVYGGIMNPASALVWTQEITLPLLASYYLTGLPMDLVHGGTTAILLWLLTEPLMEKIQRVKKKYGMIE